MRRTSTRSSIDGTAPIPGTTTSADGTTITYERSGAGPPLVLVDGAMCSRDFGPTRSLAARLAQDFRVTQYDRRGRGDSGPGTTAYHPGREVEDLAAVIASAGGDVIVVGQSSGAVLALDAANRLSGIRALVCYEPPLVVDPAGNVEPPDLRDRIEAAVAAGDRTAAVRIFMGHVGTPRIAVAVMRLLPLWRRLQAVAHTLSYDLAVLDGLGDGTDLPTDRWGRVAVPTLVLHGSKSPAWMGRGVAALNRLLPNSTHGVLDGQTHMVKPDPLAVAVTVFATGVPATAATPPHQSTSATGAGGAS